VRIPTEACFGRRVLRTSRCRGAASSRRAVRGQALIILLLMVSIAAMLLVYGSSSEVARTVKADQKTRATLEYAKQALIGRAIGDANRPGSFPCPDSDNDGSADLFVGSSCPTYIGRLPWRTLGVGDLRDESGERLWYALAPSFRDHPGAPALNSDTVGSLVVYSGSDATTISREAVAIVFAAGPALPGQARDENTALCETVGKHIPRSRCPTNYLDAASGFSNATAAGPYIAATTGPLYNDRLAAIVTADFMPQVEQRVAMDVRNALMAYKATSTCQCYPWATTANDGTSDIGKNRGRIPVRDASPESWRAGALPAYVGANDWARVIYYSVARTALENKGKGCESCVEPTLSVDGTAGHELVLLTPGPAVRARPRSTWADYLDDIENRNEDDRYVTPASADATHNRIYSVTTPLAGCAANARVLLENVPCGGSDGALRSACESARKALESCSCAAAAATLTSASCASILTGTRCEPAFSRLQACTS
jgi:hypothetical protein